MVDPNILFNAEASATDLAEMHLRQVDQRNLDLTEVLAIKIFLKNSLAHNANVVVNPQELRSLLRSIEEVERKFTNLHETHIVWTNLLCSTLVSIGAYLEKTDYENAFRCIGRVFHELQGWHEKLHVPVPYAVDKFKISAQVNVWEHCGISEERKTQLSKLEYKNYLKTNEWRWIREKAFVHYGRECTICKSKYRLEVHHRRYPRRGEETTADLIVLCRKCHATHHGKTE